MIYIDTHTLCILTSLLCISTFEFYFDRLQKDAYYDFKTEEDEVQKEKNKLQQKARQSTLC